MLVSALSTKIAVSQALSFVMCLSLLDAATSQAPTCLMPPKYITAFYPHLKRSLLKAKKKRKKEADDNRTAERKRLERSLRVAALGSLRV
jgi:hypothetical protein